MKKWEYLCAYYYETVHASILNELGNQGWELIQILISTDRANIRWVFKREKIEKVNPVEGD